MKLLKKIWERIYHYFNPTMEESLRHMGVLDDHEMTPEERAEYQENVKELYRVIENAYSSKKTENVDNENKSKK